MNEGLCHEGYGRAGKLDVAVVVRELVLDGPTMDPFGRSIGPSIAFRLATIALLQELLVLALQLVIEHDAADERAVFAQPVSVPEVGAIHLRVVRQLARAMDGESGMARTSDADVELLPAFRLLRSSALAVNVAPGVELPLPGRPLQFVAVHARPAVALADVPAAFREHDQRAVVSDGRNGLDKPRVSEVPQIAPVRVERAVLAVAEIAGGHDAEGAHGGERANLRAAQPHVAVSCPDTLTFRAARQLKVA